MAVVVTVVLIFVVHAGVIAGILAAAVVAHVFKIAAPVGEEFSSHL